MAGMWIALGVGASTAWIGLLAWSDRNPSRRLWPPHRGGWLTAAWAWALTIAIYVGEIYAAAADFNTLDLPAWFRWIVGGGVSLAGTAVQSWGAANLGLMGTSGWPAGLVTHGAYARLRHPQYLGQIATLIGIAIFAGSLLAWPVAIAGSVALYYACVVEDRHLEATQAGFGAYAARVPAFGGRNPAT